MTGSRRTLWATFGAFVAVVVLTNIVTATVGLVTWLGLTATAGTWLAGLAFVARDELDDAGGRRAVMAAILLGAGISAAFSPSLALASVAAFLLSELADFAVYRRLIARGRNGAALLSNIVGSILDTLVFLWLAHFPLGDAPTQVIVKVAASALALGGGVTIALLRQSRLAGRIARNA